MRTQTATPVEYLTVKLRYDKTFHGHQVEVNREGEGLQIKKPSGEILANYRQPYFIKGHNGEAIAQIRKGLLIRTSHSEESMGGVKDPDLLGRILEHLESQNAR